MGVVLSNRTFEFVITNIEMYAEIKTNLEADLFQDALDRLSNWANDWQLQISISKCSIMHIGTMKLRRAFFINNHALPCTTLCKELGITVDNNLTPSPMLPL